MMTTKTFSRKFVAARSSFYFHLQTTQTCTTQVDQRVNLSLNSHPLFIETWKASIKEVLCLGAGGYSIFLYFSEWRVVYPPFNHFSSPPNALSLVSAHPTHTILASTSTNQTILNSHCTVEPLLFVLFYILETYCTFQLFGIMKFSRFPTKIAVLVLGDGSILL